ncbi:MAG: hypothetical protein ACRDS0_00495 [Pseudonocardiaceae bacterium]
MSPLLDGHYKLRSVDVSHQLRARWESSYGGFSAQQFASALDDREVEVRKRSLDGQPGQRVILTADVTAHSTLNTPNSSNPRPTRAEAGCEAPPSAQGTCLTPIPGPCPTSDLRQGRQPGLTRSEAPGVE